MSSQLGRPPAPYRSRNEAGFFRLDCGALDPQLANDVMCDGLLEDGFSRDRDPATRRVHVGSATCVLFRHHHPHRRWSAPSTWRSIWVVHRTDHDLVLEHDWFYRHRRAAEAAFAAFSQAKLSCSCDACTSAKADTAVT